MTVRPKDATQSAPRLQAAAGSHVIVHVSLTTGEAIALMDAVCTVTSAWECPKLNAADRAIRKVREAARRAVDTHST
ncbi:hypothetical protein F4560_008218 [Saccharothrix ecbatanensis]|uniref:Uncharacterized protein n=1 Tax=Saccharothrix ecbatanensis TaxID=1105145 RepID=A0A7W9M5T0_9PSEU|nr:hypothetical protein [Saccharothrix ecbatanensis]